MANKFCSDCGAPLEQDAKFCGSCGAKVAVSAPQTQVAVQQTAKPVIQQAAVGNNSMEQIRQEFADISNNVSEQLNTASVAEFRQKINENSFVQSFKTNYLTTAGRLNRWAYFIKSLKLMLMNFILYLVMLVGAAMMASESALGILLGLAIELPIFGCLLVLVVASIMLGIRRCHDLGHSGWLMLICLVPIINFFGALYVWLYPGTHGDNQYGPDPLQVNLYQHSM